MTNPVACWVDIYDPNTNAKLGAGPVRHIIHAEVTAALSKAGSFTLTVAAADPRAAELQPKRVVRIYTQFDGVMTEIGAGIIDNVRWDGTLQVEVTGSDLMAELRYRSVHDLPLYTETQHAPTKVWFYNESDAPVWVDKTLTYDGTRSGSPHDHIALHANDSFLYIGFSAPFNVLYTYQYSPAAGHFNAVSAELHYGYSDGAAGWPHLDVVTDTQIVDGVPWPASLGDHDPLAEQVGYQTNTALFQRNANWKLETVNGVSAYWLRIDPSAHLGSVGFREFVIGVRANRVEDVAAIMAYAPNAWSVGDAWIYTGAGAGTTIFHSSTEGTYATFAGETVLNALIKIAERAGEAFRVGANRTLHWLRNLNPGSTGPASYTPSGIRAVQHTGSPTQDDNLLTCQIVALEKTRDTNDLITRISRNTPQKSF